MKYILIATSALLSLTQSVMLSSEGIDYKELHEGAHWKKPWPAGAIDNSDEDAEVIDRFTNPAPKPYKPEAVAAWNEYEPHSTSKQD